MTQLLSKRNIINLIVALSLMALAYIYGVSRPSVTAENKGIPYKNDTPACVQPSSAPTSTSGGETADSGGTAPTNTTSETTTKVVKHHNHNLVNVDNVLNSNSILNNNNVSVLNDVLDVGNVDVIDNVTVTDTIDGVNGTVKTIVDVL